jgi:phospholipid transport system substrate-binding protein
MYGSNCTSRSSRSRFVSWFVPLVLVVFVMLGVPALSVGAVQEESESALAVVKATLSDVLTVLDNPKLQESEKRRRIEEVVATRFDYREMSKRTLAAHWGRLTEPEREDFVASFRMFLSDRYAGKIRDYAGEKVEYLGERLEGDYAEIRTKLVSSKTNYPLDYRLTKKDGRWSAYDIVVDGVSLIKNYRSQFDRIIRTDSYGGLVRKMKNRSLAEEQQSKRKP